MVYLKSNIKSSLYNQSFRYNNDKIKSCDYISRRLIPYFMNDSDQISNKRKNNYLGWYKFLKNKNIHIIYKPSEDICPYVFACYVDDKRSANNWIEWGRKNNIIITAWPDFPSYNFEKLSTKQRNIIFFPVNHQINIPEILNEEIS